MPARHPALPLAALLLAAASAASAATPPPLDPVRFAFPGGLVSPPTAVSAGLALADRWLGDTPFENPAAAAPQGLVVSPLGERVDREDVSAANRDFTQKQGYADFGGATLATRWRGWALGAYAWQPALRLESQAYTLGRAQSVGPGAEIATDASLRELRAGLAVGRGAGAWRAGVSGEWTHRDDRYEVQEVSGSPTAGDRLLTLAGDGFGATLGVRWAPADSGRHALRAGAALHYASSLPMTGTASQQLVIGDTSYAAAATRGAQWSGGASMRWSLSPESGVYAAAGMRSGETWDDFGVRTRGGGEWHLGLDWRDPDTAWGVRFGAGQETQPGAPEPRAGLVGGGVSFYSGETTVDLGVLHRTLSRPGLPNAFEDRALLTVSVTF